MWTKGKPVAVSVAASVVAAFGMLSAVSAFAQENTPPPGEVRVWNGDVLAPHLDLIYGGRGKPLGPVNIVGARNGSFSGEIVVGSTRPIKGLRAVIGDLVHAGGAGRIAPSAIQVRYPSLDILSDWNAITKAVPHFDALHGVPPAEVPLLTRQPGKQTKWATLDHAYQPVWVTVNVPADAKPGTYEAKLSLAVARRPLARVPVKLTVHDYRLPDPEVCATCVDFVQSPETVAMYYGVPLWSDRHFELIGKSLTLLGKAGNRSVNIPFVCETNHGNSQSMVRWVKDGDPSTPLGAGTYKHDFTVMEKYLDTVERHMGKPRMVFLYVWDYQYNERKEPEGFRGCVEPSTGEVKVSFLVGEGKVTTGKLPKYGDARSEALWKPVIDGVMARLKKRGLEESALLAWATDRPPSPDIVSLFARLAPGVPWAVGSHSFYSRQDKAIAADGSPVKYATLVSASRQNRRSRFRTNFFAWKPTDRVVTAYFRGLFNNHPITDFRFLTYRTTEGGVRGVGRLGADFWPVLKDKRGRVRGTLSARYPESGWRNLDIRMSMLAPGKDGAVTTTRYEMFREGLQECETRLFLEEALLHKKVSGELAKRCRTVLDARTRVLDDLDRARKREVSYEQKDVIFEKFVDADWQKLTDDLYGVAAEVAAKLGAK